MKFLLVLWSTCIVICNTGILAWPEGSYGLPMPKSGCPHANFDWEKGTRTHETMAGSHGSDNVHLAGTTSSFEIKVVQNFCIKSYYPADGNFEWSPGQYCLFKHDDCPDNFKEGWVYWDDAAPWFSQTIQTKSGVLPDGDYDRNTKIYYCCRNDGSSSRHLRLPTSSPFYLLMYGQSCQEVEGMKATEEFLYWAGEPLLNLDGQNGVYPRMIRSRYQPQYTKMFYCYYELKQWGDSTSVFISISKMLSIVAGVGILVAFFLLICFAQRLVAACRKRRRDAEERDSFDALENDRSASIRSSGPGPEDYNAASGSINPPMVQDAKEERVKRSGRGGEDSVVDPRSYFVDVPLQQPPSYSDVMREDGRIA